MRIIKKILFEHPRSVNESFGEHWLASMRYCSLLLYAGMAALVHAFVPAWCTRTGSSIVMRIHAEMVDRLPGRPKSGSDQDTDCALDFVI